MNQHRYLPINDNSIQWDIYLTGIGKAVIPPSKNDNYPPKGHPGVYDFSWREGRVLPEYQILCISQGEGVFESTATGKVQLQAGNVIILFPEVWHRYHPLPESGWTENWISLNGEYLYRLAKRNIIAPEKAIMKIDDYEQVLSIYDKMWSKVQSLQAENSLVLSAYGLEILAMALDLSQPQENVSEAVSSDHVRNVKDELVKDAINIIWSHSHRNTSVDTIVAQLPATRRTLERKFNQVLGYSVGKEITRCRLERAKHLLVHTSMPITHVALAVGFSGADRMSKVFQRWLQITPGQYRKGNRQ